jgi:hypothetical protein
VIIELYRAWIPEEMAGNVCGICGTDDRHDMGAACHKCLEFLGMRRPDRFPTREIYEEALRKYPEPMFESEEELEAAAAAAGVEDPSEIAFKRSRIWVASR